MLKCHLLFQILNLHADAVDPEKDRVDGPDCDDGVEHEEAPDPSKHLCLENVFFHGYVRDVAFSCDMW